MSPEVVQLAARCIVNYLGGNFERYQRLIKKAMKLNEMLTCPRCGKLMVEGKKGTKNNMIPIELCTSCGYIEKGDKDA